MDQEREKKMSCVKLRKTTNNVHRRSNLEEINKRLSLPAGFQLSPNLIETMSGPLSRNVQRQSLVS